MGSPRALASLLILVLMPAIAVAQPKNDLNLKKAGELVRSAIAKSQAGDHQAAIDLYLNAYMLVQNAALLSNVGSEFQQLNKPVEALKYFCKYLEAEPTGANATYANAQAKALQIELTGSADDKNVCKPVVKPTPPPAEKPPVLPAGTELGKPAGSDLSGTKDLKDQRPESHRAGGGLKIAGLVTAGVGVIALGLGIKYGLDAQAHTDFENNFKTNNPPGTPWPSNIHAYEQEGRDLNTKQAIFTIGGGVAIAAGAALYFLGRSQASSEEHASVRPIATQNSVGLAVSGGF
ncbi:MAG: hypothetical protein JWO36_4608 [Myxococcales bacterium]|nr:hypothetical protein [Myxococcales bacterium]